MYQPYTNKDKNKIKNKRTGTGKMDQEVRAPVTNTDDLVQYPESISWKKGINSLKLSRLLHTLHGICIPLPATNTQKKWFLKN